MKPEKKKRFCASHVRSSAAVISLAIHAVLIVVAPAFGAVVYIDAAPGNTTLETSGALAEGVNFTKSGSAGSASDGLWHERTRATVNGGGAWDCGFQLGTGSNVEFTKTNSDNLSATTGHFTTTVKVNDGTQEEGDRNEKK
jgi:hypothetical protein